MTHNDNEGRGYVRSIKGMTDELSRLNDIAKEIRLERTRANQRLYQWMRSRNLTEFEGIKRHKLSPKPPRPKRKPKKVQKQDTLSLFRDAGIPDPEEFYQEFTRTQYIEPPQEE